MVNIPCRDLYVQGTYHYFKITQLSFKFSRANFYLYIYCSLCPLGIRGV